MVRQNTLTNYTVSVGTDGVHCVQSMTVQQTEMCDVIVVNVNVWLQATMTTDSVCI